MITKDRLINRIHKIQSLDGTLTLEKENTSEMERIHRRSLSRRQNNQTKT